MFWILFSCLKQSHFSTLSSTFSLQKPIRSTCDFSIRKQTYKNLWKGQDLVKVARSVQQWSPGPGFLSPLGTVPLHSQYLNLCWLFILYYFILKNSESYSRTGENPLAGAARTALNGQQPLRPLLLWPAFSWVGKAGPSSVLWSAFLWVRKAGPSSVGSPDAFWKLPRGNHFMVNVVGSNESSHTGCQGCC